MANNTNQEIIELHANYRVLSELWEPKSKHKTQIAIGKKMDAILKRIEEIKKEKQFGGTKKSSYLCINRKRLGLTPRLKIRQVRP